MIDWANALVGAVLGGLVGLGLVYLVDFIRMPECKPSGFSKTVDYRDGQLINLNFKVIGSQSPGICSMLIKWDDHVRYAKWDETPEPVDNSGIFLHWLVPQTYYNNIFLNHEYSVPIIYTKDGKHEIFCGWWFGRNNGYGPNLDIQENTKVRLTLIGGAGLSWSKEYVVSAIIAKANRQ